MKNYVIVRPEHLNHHGYLFGGQMLKWIDEFAWITAAVDFPERKLVTRFMGNSSFNRGIPLGAILEFDTKQLYMRTTSATYQTDVYIKDNKVENKNPVFSTVVTFTAVDENGKKTPIR